MSGAASRSRRWVVLLAYLRLPHAVPVLVVLATTLGFALVAESGWPGLGTAVRLLGAMLGAQLAIGAVNELVDAELDAIAKPTKPIPAGLVSRRGALTMAVGGVALAVALGATFGRGVLALTLLGMGTGVLYSVVFKRSIWSWVPYLVAVPLLPIWVWAALDGVDLRLLAVYPIGASAVVAVQLAQSLPDVERDARTGVRTLAVAVGERRAREMCWGALLLAAVLASLLAPALTDHALRVWIAAVAALVLVAVNAAIWTRDPARGALACFPCVAVGAAALGIGWAAALVGG